MKRRTKKKIWASIAIFLLWAIVFPQLASLQGPYVHAKSGEISEATGELTHVENIWDTFYYNDEMLLDRIGSNECSGEISLASVGLAAAAYDDKKIISMLDQMGYSQLYISPYYHEKTTHDNNNVVAYSIYEKYVDYGGELYRIVVVPVRGTPASCEWYSNFDIGTGEKHHGFYTAAEDVMDNLRGVLEEPLYDADQTVLWTMGHSRGAAVANIIAGELSTGEEWQSLISADHIFGYTYACPAVSTIADTSLLNIYNYNNGGDVVPALPLASWGFRRFGQTMILPESDYDNVANRFFIAMGEEYDVNMSTESWEDILMTIAPTQESFVNNEVIQFAVDILSWLMGGKTDRSYGIFKIIMDHAGTAVGVLAVLLKIKNSPLSDIITSIKGMSSDEIMALLDKGRAYLNDLKDELEAAMNDENLDWDAWESSHDNLIEAVKMITGIKISSPDDLPAAYDKLENACTAFEDLVVITRDTISLYFDMDGNLSSTFTQGHSQDTTYTMWVNSMYFGYTGWFCNKEITSIDWEDQIQKTYVGDYCFYGCTGLE